MLFLKKRIDYDKHPYSAEVHMRRNLILVCLAAAVLHMSPLYGQSSRKLLPYHENALFLQGPAGSIGQGLLGYVNPARAGDIHGPQLLYWFTDKTKGILGENRGATGLFTAIPGLHFGYIRRPARVLTADSTWKTIRCSDYRIATAFGNSKYRFGVGYSRLSGDTRFSGSSRENLLCGVLFRPGPLFSLGISGRFAMRSDAYELVSDVGFRPFGDGRITLFSELAYMEDRTYTDVTWSLGAGCEPLPGLQITARYDEDRRITAGLSLSLGRMSLYSTARQSRTSFGIRYGAPLPNVPDLKLHAESGYVYLSLRGHIRNIRYRFLDRGGPTLVSLIQTLQAVREDPRVAGCALNLSGLVLSAETAWELRKELQKVRESGRRVVIFIDRAGMNGYHLASVADCLVVDPQAYLLLPGYAMGRTYLAGLMDRIGLGFDEWRFFRYKSAYENYSRQDMSEADREQRLALLDAFFTTFVNDVSESRHMSPAALDSLINTRGGFTAPAAVEAGLADRTGRWNQADDIIAGLEGRSMKRFSATDLTPAAYPDARWGRRPRIALVYAEGVCDLDAGIQARTLEGIIRKLAVDKEVAALVLRVNSPGGDGLASDLVAEAIKECRVHKPVIVSQGAVAASGGYWLSMYADSVFAAPTTVTGSIGVIGGWVWDKGLSRSLDITTERIQKGDHADLMLGLQLPFLTLPLPARNLTPDERSIIEEGIRSMYNDFVAKVAAGRRMSAAQIKKIAQGRVWSGRDALANGLIDGIGGLARALESARAMAGITSSERAAIIEMPYKGMIDLTSLLPSLPLISTSADGLPAPWEYISLFARNNGKPLYILPYDVSILGRRQ